MIAQPSRVVAPCMAAIETRANAYFREGRRRPSLQIDIEAINRERREAMHSTAAVAQLTNSEIVKARASSRRPQRDKGTALVGALTIVAHDLRGPLANLAVLIELIDAYAQVEAFDRVKATTGKAQVIIGALDEMLNGFIERTRETGDPLSFKPAITDAADAIGNGAELNRPMAESRGIEIDVAEARPLAIFGDGRLISEAVGNLVSNATKYAPEGSTVRCAVERRGTWCVISVRDEGPGLSGADLARAFRPFTNLSAGYQGRGGSWGLGLWIVRLICERHGGFVEVPSGTDARFEMHLPIDGP